MTRVELEEAVVAARGWAEDQISYTRVFRSKVSEVRARKGIYFALNLYGELDYIGSASRTNEGGLAARVLRHNNPRRSRWWAFYFLPLRDETPTGIVRQIEGDCIRRFGPPANMNIPGLVWIRHYPGIIATH